LAEVLARRAKELPPPVQMCDALSRNTTPPLKTVQGNCVAHGRRKFAEVVSRSLEESRHVLETVREVYRNDAAAKKQDMSPEERLRFHQTRSRPLLTPLRRWMRQQIRERKVESNSALGQALVYMDRHWKKLTLFLRVPGAPLDNNICEAALKRSILHRKNSLFYKTQHGANVGDLFMSLIHTCALQKVNALDYLTELQIHARELALQPQAWMPWNYRETLAAAAAGQNPQPV
ncbi:MAG: transposase, partial [Planctomycetes bacterium]|nr:transposase [Planctomycetota bacterium]